MEWMQLDWDDICPSPRAVLKGAITFDLFSLISFTLSMLHCNNNYHIMFVRQWLYWTQVSCTRIWLFCGALTYIYFISYSLGIYVGGLCWSKSYFVTDTRTGVKLCWGHPNPFALSNPARPLLFLCLHFKPSLSFPVFVFALPSQSALLCFAYFACRC